MPLIYTNYLFCKSILEKIDSTYQTKLRTKFDLGSMLSEKLFIYSNIVNIPLCYLKNNNYNLYTDISNVEYQKKLYIVSKEYIIKNHYNKNNILLTLCIICSNILNNFTSDFFNFMKNYDKEIFKRDIDYIYAKEFDNTDLTAVVLTNTFDKSLILDFNDLDMLKDIFNSTFNFPKADTFYEISLKNFKKLLSAKSLRRYYYSMQEIDKLFIYSKNTIVSTAFINSPIYKEHSFVDLFELAKENAYKQCCKYLDEILL